LPITGNMLEALYMYISAVIHSVGTWRLGCLPQGWQNCIRDSSKGD